MMRNIKRKACRSACHLILTLLVLLGLYMLLNMTYVLPVRVEIRWIGLTTKPESGDIKPTVRFINGEEKNKAPVLWGEQTSATLKTNVVKENIPAVSQNKKTNANHEDLQRKSPEMARNKSVDTNNKVNKAIPMNPMSDTLNHHTIASLEDNPYNIVNKTICSAVKTLHFIIIVHTAAFHFDHRRSIRNTWFGRGTYNEKTVRIAFLLGKTDNDTVQSLVDQEHRKFGDIIQGKFMDSYHNLTHKAVMGIRWIVEHCANANFVLKIDDDVFVNVFKLTDDFLKQYAGKSRSAFCLVRPNGTASILRNPGSKWMVDKSIFPNLTTYPFTYCLGFFVLYTNDIIPELLRAAKSTPFFWIDDIYISGMLVNKVGNISFTRVHVANQEAPSINCYNATKPCGLLGATAKSHRVMQLFWDKTLNDTKKTP